MFWFFVGFVVVVAVIIGVSNGNKLVQAKKSYEESLAKLKSDPANSDLRQQTLAFGRAYSNLARDSKGRTIFDEIALMNDLNAACAATQQVISNQTLQTTSQTVAERLVQLQGLKDQGLIDQIDFDRRKSEILAQI